MSKNKLDKTNLDKLEALRKSLEAIVTGNQQKKNDTPPRIGKKRNANDDEVLKHMNEILNEDRYNHKNNLDTNSVNEKSEYSISHKIPFLSLEVLHQILQIYLVEEVQHHEGEEGSRNSKYSRRKDTIVRPPRLGRWSNLQY